MDIDFGEFRESIHSGEVFKAASTIIDLKSRSDPGYDDALVYFKANVDMDELARQVRFVRVAQGTYSEPFHRFADVVSDDGFAAWNVMGDEPFPPFRSGSELVDHAFCSLYQFDFGAVLQSYMGVLEREASTILENTDYVNEMHPASFYENLREWVVEEVFHHDPVTTPGEATPYLDRHQRLYLLGVESRGHVSENPNLDWLAYDATIVMAAFTARLDGATGVTSVTSVEAATPLVFARFNDLMMKLNRCFLEHVLLP